MKTIPLTNGKEAIVDDDDFDYLSQFKWYDCDGYPTTVLYFRELNGLQNRQSTAMHRLLMGCTVRRTLVIDHINRNPLDNRRDNLRIVSMSDNMINSDWMDSHILNREKRYLTRQWNGSWQIRIKGKYYGQKRTLPEAMKARDEVLRSVQDYAKL